MLNSYVVVFILFKNFITVINYLIELNYIITNTNLIISFMNVYNYDLTTLLLIEPFIIHNNPSKMVDRGSALKTTNHVFFELCSKLSSLYLVFYDYRTN